MGDPKCGSKGCWAGSAIANGILALLGLILFIMFFALMPDDDFNKTQGQNPDYSAQCYVHHVFSTNDRGVSTIDCEDCYENESEKRYQELCCSDTYDCDQAHALLWCGLVLGIVGTALFGMSMCGCAACCCFADDGPASNQQNQQPASTGVVTAVAVKA